MTGDTSARHDGWWWRGSLALVGLSLLASHYLLTLEAGDLVSLHEDDVFYYAMVARQLTEGAWPTFDGVSTTNGFHPLWAVLLTPAIWLGQTSESQACHLFAVQFAWFLTAALLLYRILGTWTDRRIAFLTTAWFVLDRRFYRIVLNGLETPVLVALLLASVLALTAWSRRGGMARSLNLGFALGLTFLARLEAGAVAVLVFGSVSALQVIRGPRQLRELLVAMAAAAVPFTAWIVALVLPNGTITPVSGALKRLWAEGKPGASPSAWISFTTPWESIDRATPDGFYWCLAAAAAYAVVRTVSARRAESEEVGSEEAQSEGVGSEGAEEAPGTTGTLGTAGASAVDALVATGFLAAFANKLAYDGHALPYYYTAPLVMSQLVALGIVVGSLVRALRIPRVDGAVRAGITAASLGLLLVLTLPGQAHLQRFIRGHVSDYDRYVAAVWMREQLPEDAVCASFNSGIYAFFCERTLINLDGKINSIGFFEDVVRLRATSPIDFEIALLTYLRDHDVRYLVEKGELGTHAYRWTFGNHPEVLEAIPTIGRFPSRQPGFETRVYRIEWDTIDALGVLAN